MESDLKKIGFANVN